MTELLLYNCKNVKKRTLLGVELPDRFSTEQKNEKFQIEKQRIKKAGFNEKNA